MAKDPNKVKQGKRNKAQGAAFELRVRKDLEEKGWIVSKWQNNVELPEIIKSKKNPELLMDCLDKIKSFGKLIPAKTKWAGPGRPMVLGSGFPDFVAFTKNTKIIKCSLVKDEFRQVVIGVESKINGYLTKEERAKCKWLLDNSVFSRILIARKTKVKNKIKIIYEDFEEKYGNKK